jgi:hypothetical protein
MNQEWKAVESFSFGTWIKEMGFICSFPCKESLMITIWYFLFVLGLMIVNMKLK